MANTDPRRMTDEAIDREITALEARIKPIATIAATSRPAGAAS